MRSSPSITMTDAIGRGAVRRGRGVLRRLRPEIRRDACASADEFDDASLAFRSATAPVPRGPMGPTRLQLSKPVIAAIAGPAVAGGMELALWCDLRVMEQSAYMGVYCRRWGVPLIDGGTVRLPRIVGRGRALDIILTGRKVPAEECYRIGLCERLVPDGESRAAAEALAHEIARFPQGCMRADRRSVWLQEGLSEMDGLALRMGLLVRHGGARGCRRRRALFLRQRTAWRFRRYLIRCHSRTREHLMGRLRDKVILITGARRRHRLGDRRSGRAQWRACGRHRSRRPRRDRSRARRDLGGRLAARHRRGRRERRAARRPGQCGRHRGDRHRRGHRLRDWRRVWRSISTAPSSAANTRCR